jgi:hypothetical protein
LTDAEGVQLLPCGAGAFFTEHSDRAGLDSWAAALGVGASERAFLGRWRAGGSTDAYVRTALRVVENVQLLSASRAQQSLRAGPDFFGKEELLNGMFKFLVCRGWSESDAAAVEKRLRVADYSLNPQQQLPDLPKDWSLADWSLAALPSNEVTVPEAVLVHSEPPAPEAELVHAFDLAVQADRAPAVPVQGYVISVTRGGLHRKLHHVRSCRFVPGVNYRQYEVYGDVMPGMSVMDSRCSWCFGRGLGLNQCWMRRGPGLRAWTPPRLRQRGNQHGRRHASLESVLEKCCELHLCSTALFLLVCLFVFVGVSVLGCAAL